jgi:type VII secretion-associated serine protease mycosin
MRWLNGGAPGRGIRRGIIRRAAAAAAAIACTGAVLVPTAAAPAFAAAVCGPRITAPLAEPAWAQTRLRPDLAWPLSTGTGVTVAVIDSGVSADHPALAGKVLRGRDYLLAQGGDGHCDENGHGTLIAGIIAGREETSAGFRFFGVAPGAQILPVRVLLDQQRSSDPALSGRIADAIRWVVDVGHAEVINLSLTTPPTPGLAAAVQYAIQSDAVVVAAAGNTGDIGTGNGTDHAVYPAAYPGVLAVAGTDANDQHVSTSTAGPFVDVAAPGLRIAGPSPAGGGYLFAAEGGTSFAAAYVSGVAALIRGYDPGLSPAQVSQRITETAQHPAGRWNPEVGSGVVDPVRAVGALVPAVAGAGRAAGNASLRIPVVHRTGPSATMVAAVLVAAGSVVVAGLVLAAVPIVRRGRSRAWRTGRRQSV